MKKDQITILEDRGIISVSGKDAKDFLQNIISNDVDKVSKTSSIFSAIFTPQGKYLYEFFMVKLDNGYLLDCDNNFTNDIINHLSKYKLRSQIKIEDLSSKYVIGIITFEKFREIQVKENKNTDTVLFRESSIFLDPRKKKLGARILSSLEKLYLTIKILNLEIIHTSNYLIEAHLNGIPIKGIENLKDKLFGLEANLEELKAIDFKKGCYVGQENTARMKLKNKLRRRLLAIKADGFIKAGSQVIFNNIKIGKVLIGGYHPFALIKLFNPEFSEFKDKEILADDKKVKIINSY